MCHCENRPTRILKSKIMTTRHSKLCTDMKFLLESQDECCYDTRCYFNVCSKADISQLNLGHTHTRLMALFSGTTQVSWYQKGKTSLDFTEARDSEWQWKQLGHMQICTLLQTDNHTSSPPLCFYRPDALPATQPTASKH